MPRKAKDEAVDQPEPDKRKVTIFLDTEDMKHASELAKELRLSVSAVVRMAMRRGLAEVKKRGPAALTET